MTPADVVLDPPELAQAELAPVRMDPVGMDPESAQWVCDLSSPGAGREEAAGRLQVLLLRVARSEVRRRSGQLQVSGPEADDLAHQAAADAAVAILSKVGQFRGDSRFTTWAYSFVVFEVSGKVGRHMWQHPTVAMAGEVWDQLPDRFGLDPAARSQWQDLMDALRRALVEVLTVHQRRVFGAIVLAGVPVDALAVELDSTRNALYKTMFDARRKLRAALVTTGHLDAPSGRPRNGLQVSNPSALDRFLTTDPADVGCARALQMLHVYADLIRIDQAAATRRYPGITAHLHACGPCHDDFDGLVAALTIPTAPAITRLL